MSLSPPFLWPQLGWGRPTKKREYVIAPYIVKLLRKRPICVMSAMHIRADMRYHAKPFIIHKSSTSSVKLKKYHYFIVYLRSSSTFLLSLLPWYFCPFWPPRWLVSCRQPVYPRVVWRQTHPLETWLTVTERKKERLKVSNLWIKPWFVTMHSNKRSWAVLSCGTVCCCTGWFLLLSQAKP